MKTFLELGSAYWDTLHESLGSQEVWSGVTVDARQEFLDMLPNRPNVKKVCGLVAAYETYHGSSKGDFYYVPHDLVVARGLPQWLDGCGSTNRDHAILRLFSDVAVKHTVLDLVPVRSLLQAGLHTLKTDLEGGDFDVIFSVLGTNVLPVDLEFEVAHMSPEKVSLLDVRLRSLKYVRQDSASGDSARYVREVRMIVIDYQGPTIFTRNRPAGYAVAVDSCPFTVRKGTHVSSGETSWEVLCVERFALHEDLQEGARTGLYLSIEPHGPPKVGDELRLK